MAKTSDNVYARLAAFKDPIQKRALELLFGDIQNNLIPTTHGTAPGTGITVEEFCVDGYNHTSVITLDGVSAVLPAIAGGAALGIGRLVYTLPAGEQIINSASISVAITQTQGHITADTPTIGLGTVVASGVISVLSGTATFQNILTGVATADCNGTAKVSTANPTAAVPLVIAAAGAKSIYLNAAATWAASGDAAAKLSGTIVVTWQGLA